MKVLIYLNLGVAILYLMLNMSSVEVSTSPMALIIIFAMFTTFIQLIIGIIESIHSKSIDYILWSGMLIVIIYVVGTMVLGPNYGKQ